jgi:hypothetical protein
MKTPILVAFVLGLITYLVVFNLNLITATLQTLISAPKAYLLSKMMESPSKEEEYDG